MIRIAEEDMKMEWLEIIALSSVNDELSKLESQLNCLANEISKKEPSCTVRIFQNSQVDTELSVHLMHQSETHFRSCPLGNRIASQLSSCGLIRQTIWIRKV